jgi:aminoglycoside phosphotransferase (APT) family kinase protein
MQAQNTIEAFDAPALARLNAYLYEHVPDFDGIQELSKFEGGQSNPTYRLNTATRNYVLRTKPGPASELLPSAHAIDREYRVISALGRAGIPVPETFVHCEDEGIIGRQFYLMGFVSGRIFWDQALPMLPASERSAIYGEMNRVIAALHSVDPADAGLADFGKPGNYFGRQISRWTKQYRASQTQVQPAMEHLMEWLPRHIPEGEETCIVHGDFRLDNLVFHPTEPRVVAILDWELATLGHPLADFSYHCLGYRIAPQQFRGIAGLDLPALGIPSEQAYIAMYCDRTGRHRIDDWEYYIAYNLFRLAAILQGIAKRAEDGTAAASDAARVGAQARELAKLGWAAALRCGKRE